tara:strand:+ start:176 stop:1150 length:975 start_codon:yes stop_codon:yes gene_type:complete
MNRRDNLLLLSNLKKSEYLVLEESKEKNATKIHYIIEDIIKLWSENETIFNVGDEVEADVEGNDKWVTAELIDKVGGVDEQYVVKYTNLAFNNKNEIEVTLGKNKVRSIGETQSPENIMVIKRLLEQFYRGTTISGRTYIHVYRHPLLDINMRNNIKFDINLNQLITIIGIFDNDMNNINSNKYKRFLKLNNDLLDVFLKKTSEDEQKIAKGCNSNETTEECNVRLNNDEEYKTETEKMQEQIKEKEDEEKEKRREEEQERLEKIREDNEENIEEMKGGNKPIIINDGINKRYALLNNKKYQIINDTKNELLIAKKDKFKRISI